MNNEEKEIRICKSKVTVVHNEIDYDKLAESIVKAQEKSEEKNKPKGKIGFLTAIGEIILNKEDKNGKRTAFVLAEIMAYIFNFAAIVGVIFSVGILVSIFMLEWNISFWSIVVQAIMIAILLLMSISITLIFRGIANEIKAEKDRNYITTLFFGFTSLASLIVALVALFKGVG